MHYILFNINMKNVMARGTLYVLISSLFFMMSGFIIHFGLGKFLVLSYTVL